MDRRGGRNEDREGAFSGRFVLVYSAPSITDGYLVRGRLEADGIPVVVKGEAEGPYRMGPVHILVPTELEVQARLLLSDIRSGRLRLPDDHGERPGSDWLEPESGAGSAAGPDPESEPTPDD